MLPDSREYRIVLVTPDADERREAAIANPLDQRDRHLARLEREVSIGVECLALFIRFSLNTTPPLPEPAATAARAQAGARCDNVIATPGRWLNEGPKLRQCSPGTPEKTRSGFRMVPGMQAAMAVVARS